MDEQGRIAAWSAGTPSPDENDEAMGRGMFFPGGNPVPECLVGHQGFACLRHGLSKMHMQRGGGLSDMKIRTDFCLVVLKYSIPIQQDMIV